MGLFGFIGRAVGGLAKGVLGVAKIAAPIAGTLIGGPLGGKVGALASSLLGSKSPMNAHKYAGISTLGTMRSRGNVTQGGYGAVRGIAAAGGRVPAPVLRLSPVLPGGAIATTRGPQPAVSAVPPSTYAGGRGGPVRRKRRAAARTRKRTTTRRRKGRKLKFGSQAWRKKYLKRRRR